MVSKMLFIQRGLHYPVLKLITLALFCHVAAGANITATVGHTGQIYCPFTRASGVLYSVTWYRITPRPIRVYLFVGTNAGNTDNFFNNRHINHTYSDNGSSLIIHDVQACDAAQYRCDVQQAGQTTPLVVLFSYLAVNSNNELVNISSDPNGLSTPFDILQSLTITCEVTNGSPAPLLSWKKQDEMGNDIPFISWETPTGQISSNASNECLYNGSIALNITVQYPVTSNKVRFLCMNGESSIGNTSLITYPATSLPPTVFPHLGIKWWGWFLIGIAIGLVTSAVIIGIVVLCWYCGGCNCKQKSGSPLTDCSHLGMNWKGWLLIGIAIGLVISAIIIIIVICCCDCGGCKQKSGLPPTDCHLGINWWGWLLIGIAIGFVISAVIIVIVVLCWYCGCCNCKQKSGESVKRTSSIKLHQAMPYHEAEQNRIVTSIPAVIYDNKNALHLSHGKSNSAYRNQEKYTVQQSQQRHSHNYKVQHTSYPNRAYGYGHSVPIYPHQQYQDPRQYSNFDNRGYRSHPRGYYEDPSHGMTGYSAHGYSTIRNEKLGKYGQTNFVL